MTRLVPRRRLAVALAVTAPLVAGVAASPAAAATNPPLYGNDVSWPQCPKGMGIPERPSYGLPMPSASARLVVIGLTNGPAFTPNPCLRSQVGWAKRHHTWTGAYAVTTYPTAAQLRRYATAGPYTGRGTLTSLRNAGYAQARYNLATARAAGLVPRHVWVDVEPYSVRPWSRSTQNNRAVIEGVVRGYTSAGKRVGFYSYPNGWREITGGWRTSRPVWATAGRTSRAAAARKCSEPSFSGGRVVLSQWYTDTVDHDITCPGVTGRTAGRSPLYPYRTTVLRQGSRGPAVVALQRRLRASADGIFGPKTRAAVVAFQKAHRLRASGVVDGDDWRAMGAYRTTTAAPSQLPTYFIRF